MAKFQTPVGDLDDPYELGDRDRDINQRTPPSAGWKAREDSVLSQQKGPIPPVSRVGAQLAAEDDVAGNKKFGKAAQLQRRRPLTKPRAMGGKR